MRPPRGGDRALYPRSDELLPFLACLQALRVSVSLWPLPWTPPPTSVKSPAGGSARLRAAEASSSDDG